MLLLPEVAAQQSSTFFSNFIRDIINPVLDIILKSSCDVLESTILYYDRKEGVTLNDFMDCTCSLPFTIRDGLSTNLFCALAEPICFDPENSLYCGTTNMEVNYNFRRKNIQTKTCLEIEAGVQLPFLDSTVDSFRNVTMTGDETSLPIQESNTTKTTNQDQNTTSDSVVTSSIQISPTPSLLCFKTLTRLSSNRLLAIDTCSIRIGNQNCQSCVVCPSGRDILFDCQNIILTTISSSSQEVTIFGPKVNTCVGIGLITNPIRNILTHWTTPSITATLTDGSVTIDFTNFTAFNNSSP
jgi:hypothetical protein